MNDSSDSAKKQKYVHSTRNQIKQSQKTEITKQVMYSLLEMSILKNSE